ncbi:MAG: peptide deformylase [Acidobacteria bacterium]|nr:peptide deformylase [Acidobacteriota bacterium]
MPVRRIVKFGDPVLQAPTARVAHITDEIRDLVRDMFETMYAAPGVGLAANQVGVGLRIAVIDTSVGEDPDARIVMINPEVISSSGTQVDEEGCLSIPGFTEFVQRPMKAAFRALDLEGREFTMEGEGFLARAICHETDHLDGRLYIHRLGGIKRSLITKRIRKSVDAGDWEEVYP